MMSRHFVTDDLADVQRMWKECGWVDSDEGAALIGSLLEEAMVRVGEVDGAVESLASGHPGVMSYDGSDIDAVLVTAVTTSWVGRKRGLARRVTADVLADAVDRGAHVASLGIFEHGFYNMLGFGSGPYEHHVSFDPAALEATSYRTPSRIGPDDHAEIAASLRRRKRSHGGVAIDGSTFMKAELGWQTPPFGLGYRDEDGRLTHFVAGNAKGEEGPYHVHFIAYETTDQLMELFGMLRSLGDQVRSVSMAEPPEVQIQDLVKHPFRTQTVTKGGRFEAGIRSNAWWQVRILDLAACVSHRRWHGAPIRFNLRLSDPLGDVRSDGWRGIAGDHVVDISAESTVEPGSHPALPTLTASVGAFSRMWLGVRSASHLAVTDDLAGPAELLAGLDDAFRLPTPRTGLYF